MTFDPARFRQEPIYRANARIDEVLPGILQLRLIDREAEKQKRRWGWVSLLSIVLTVVFVFCFGITLAEHIHPFAPIAAAAASGSLFLLAYVRYSKHDKLDLDDHRYQLLRELLRLLQTDMAPEQTVEVQMDLRAPDDRSKLQGEGKVRGWNVKYYQDSWLSLRGRLLDGTHFQLGMVQKLQRRDRWVRTRRGKHKHKYKSKERALAWVRLRVKPEKHPQLAQLGHRASGAVRLLPGTSLRALDVTAEGLSLEVDMGPWEAIDTGREKVNASRLFAMMLLSCYQVLNFSRSQARVTEKRVSG